MDIMLTKRNIQFIVRHVVSFIQKTFQNLLPILLHLFRQGLLLVQFNGTLHSGEEKLVDQDRAFVLETGTESLISIAEWHTTQILLFETPGRKRLLYTAIRAADFDFVTQAATADPKTFDPR